MNLKQISILGCGWLGFPLAKSLISSGYKVKGSVRREQQLAALTASSIHAYNIELKEDEITGDFANFLKDSSVLIISIPPGLIRNPSENYVAKIMALLPYIEKSNIQNVLFISSTSVYADDNSVVTEKTVTKPNTESGKQLLMVENWLQDNAVFKTTILRFGGLIGPDRHPINWLTGKTELKNPDAPVNLIHLDDCIGIIKSIIEKEKWGKVFNGVASFHPTRKEYYSQVARLKGLDAPVFNQNSTSKGKTVSGKKAETILNYYFKHQSHY